MSLDLKSSRGQRVAEVVATIAKRYSRKVWWMDRADFEQESWLVALQIEKGFESTEDNLAGYVRNALVRHLSRYSWRYSAPVSAGKPELRLRGLQRADADELPLASPSNPEAEILKAQAARLLPKILEAVEKAVEEIYREEGFDACTMAELDSAIFVLLYGDLSSDVARDANLDVRTVYRITDRVTRALKTYRGAGASLRELREQIRSRHDA